MAKYLLVFNGGAMPEGEVAQKAVLDAWTAWYTKLGDAVADPGNPTTPNAKTIHSDGKVTNGPVGGVMASGYTILKADSLDAAVALAKGCPVLAGGAQISVFETFDVM